MNRLNPLRCVCGHSLGLHSNPGLGCSLISCGGNDCTGFINLWMIALIAGASVAGIRFLADVIKVIV